MTISIIAVVLFTDLENIAWVLKI